MPSRFALLALSILIALPIGLPLAASADEVDDEFRAAVSKLLTVQNTPQSVADQVTFSIAQQTLGSLAANGIEITPQLQEIMFEESRKAFGARFSEVAYLADLYTPVYAEHYSKKELLELIAFWESPVGKKTIEVMPQMTEGSFAILDKASTTFFAEYQTAVDKRLEAAGIVLKP